MCSDNIRHSLNSEVPKTQNIKSSLDIIDFSSEYLDKMVHRINDFSRDIDICESYNLASELIENSLLCLKHIIENNNITIVKNLSYEIYLNCDREHFTETLVNIIKNSCEALRSEEGSFIKIEIFGSPNVVNISITDNGCGIKKENISRVLNPFFTTKKQKKISDLAYPTVLKFCKNTIVIW